MEPLKITLTSGLVAFLISLYVGSRQNFSDAEKGAIRRYPRGNVWMFRLLQPVRWRKLEKIDQLLVGIWLALIVVSIAAFLLFVASNFASD